MPRRLLFLLLILTVAAAAGVWRWRTAPRPSPGGADHAAGMAALERGDLDQAVSLLRQAILRDPGNGEFHGDLGDLYFRQRKYERAAAELQMSAYLSPDRPHVQCRLAQVLVEHRRRDEALRALSVDLKKTPNCPLALAVRAEQLLRDDNRKAALADFRKVIALQPDFALAYQKAGYILLQTNQPAEAIALLERGLAANPSDPGMHFLMAEALTRSATGSAGSGAEQHYLRAIPNNPESAKARAALGQYYLKAGRKGEARNQFETALRESPYLVEALFGLAQVARKEGRASEAAGILRQLKQIQAWRREMAELEARAAARPHDVPIRIIMARRLMDKGLHEQAERRLDEAVAADPARREARELRGMAYERSDHPERAAAEYDIASRLPRYASR